LAKEKPLRFAKEKAFPLAVHSPTATAIQIFWVKESALVLPSFSLSIFFEACAELPMVL
jgi:hypothetical protein